MIRLTSKVSIYVPSTTDVSVTIDTSSWVAKVASTLSSYFGGATSTEASGFWVSDKDGLVREKVTIVYAYCTSSDLELRQADVLALAEEMKAELKQEAVSVEINNELYLI